MITPHLKKLKLRAELTDEEERVIRSLVASMKRAKADELLVRAGERLETSMLLLDGWAVRSKDLPSGERQVLEIHLPGDFMDLHGYTLRWLEHDVVSITDCSVAMVPHERLTEVFNAHPRLARLYWLSTNIDASITREMALSLGQRSAISRMAHLFCELHARLGIVGRTKGNTIEFPLTQRELAECLGLTVVHVNRTLQELRRSSLIEAENWQVTILDKAGLEAIADFDPAYLHMQKHDLD